MSSSQVGILIPLNKSLEEEKSLPELPVSEGDNVIGRCNVPVTDKRLSRKHLILSASSDGSADLLVEGMNPVVVNSGGQRKVLNSGEKASVNYGDILELMPGSHYFKYVALSNQRNTDAVSKGSKGARERTNLGDGRKRAREDLNFGASMGHLTLQHGIGKNVKENIDNVSVESKRQNHSVSRNTEEALRDFHVSNGSLPSTFRLMKMQGLPEWANTSCASIDNVIEGNVIVAVLSNYMVDID